MIQFFCVSLMLIHRIFPRLAPVLDSGLPFIRYGTRTYKNVHGALKCCIAGILICVCVCVEWIKVRPREDGRIHYMCMRERWKSQWIMEEMRMRTTDAMNEEKACNSINKTAAFSWLWVEHLFTKNKCKRRTYCITLERRISQSWYCPISLSDEFIIIMPSYTFPTKQNKQRNANNFFFVFCCWRLS